MGNVGPVQLTWRNGLDQAEVAEVVALLDAAAEADGVAPAGEHVLMRLRAHRDVAQQIEPVQADVRSEHFVVRNAADELLGYAHLDTADETDGLLVAELAVHPAQRRGGVGTRLVRALLERADLPVEGAGEDTGRLRIWSHGEHPGALRLAERFGFARPRELWRMGLRLAAAELPEARRPTACRSARSGPAPTRPPSSRSITERSDGTRAGRDERGGSAREGSRGLVRRGGFFLAVDPQDRLLGFHWTKVHPDGRGEVYVVGVDPDTQGSGLGKVLTAAGLRHLRAAGCAEVLLYVEGDNAPAIKVYSAWASSAPIWTCSSGGDPPPSSGSLIANAWITRWWTVTRWNVALLT
ncbi:hypothetical protein GCM10020366_01670 [Saccharopolyspora gregorii]|uniref:N-acetyltransferase domain-containing protein n=1 Tax=Saccharopolyspora gregorii TaxID=33914 RepID=A0ABP6RI43_9PSEU